MKTIQCGVLLVTGLFGALAVSAADTATGADASCRQETKRVAVWPRVPPKAPQMARFEDRLLTICDGKIVSSVVVPRKDTMQANSDE